MDESDAVPFMEMSSAPKGVDMQTWFDDYVMPKSTPTYSFSGLSSYSEWRPHNILYVNYGRRLISFDNWPKQMRPTPLDLAGAGFYYTGYGDSVRCFSCGIQLHDWKVKDSAMTEHKKWSPSCKYLDMVYTE